MRGTLELLIWPVVVVIGMVFFGSILWKGVRIFASLPSELREILSRLAAEFRASRQSQEVQLDRLYSLRREFPRSSVAEAVEPSRRATLEDVSEFNIFLSYRGLPAETFAGLLHVVSGLYDVVYVVSLREAWSGGPHGLSESAIREIRPREDRLEIEWVTTEHSIEVKFRVGRFDISAKHGELVISIPKSALAAAVTASILGGAATWGLSTYNSVLDAQKARIEMQKDRIEIEKDEIEKRKLLREEEKELKEKLRKAPAASERIDQLLLQFQGLTRENPDVRYVEVSSEGIGPDGRIRP
jgi:hypothetical protein